MIRDPSDGSVKPPAKPVLETGTSGLSLSKEDQVYADRLNKSREWLKNWKAEKGKS